MTPSHQDALKRTRATRGLIFSENKNDADSISNLTKALWPDAPAMKYRRRPLVLIRGRRDAEARKNAGDIAAVVKAEQVVADVRFIVAHQDCDAVEPHEPVARQIKDTIRTAGIDNVIAVAPAWEIEAWWYLWPDAVAAVNTKWKRLNRRANHGMIANAKEALKRDLRNKGALDYQESDSIKIAEKVRALGIVKQRTGHAPSFNAFEAEIERLASRL